ncbi:helix-turn-helix domain-containing protein [Phascolarctobacterium succinatutens]|uniref:helix-turn-helix domain-containing protein n=1 Tax=Phascolarctobacterium succinatutens TaxID=626940 RepID=UPI0026ECCC5A|nr:helix-turn-helix transcriptional regulator [Phascolarctobacterium succinatutens]
MEVHYKFKETRKSAGLTQKEVATVVGVNQNTYSYWENGKTKIDSESLAKLSELFGVTTDFLLDKAPCKTTVDSVNDKPAVRSDEEKLLGVYNSLDQESKTQLMSVAYLIMSKSLETQGINVQQLIEQQLHKIQEKGGEKDEG